MDIFDFPERLEKFGNIYLFVAALFFFSILIILIVVTLFKKSKRQNIPSKLWFAQAIIVVIIVCIVVVDVTLIMIQKNRPYFRTTDTGAKIPPAECYLIEHKFNCDRLEAKNNEGDDTLWLWYISDVKPEFAILSDPRDLAQTVKQENGNNERIIFIDKENCNFKDGLYEVRILPLKTQQPAKYTITKDTVFHISLKFNSYPSSLKYKVHHSAVNGYPEYPINLPNIMTTMDLKCGQ